MLRPLLLLALFPAGHALAADFPSFRAQEIDPRVGEVCYAVATSDVNGDGKPDVVAVASDAVVWYENPSWAKHDVIRGATGRDNVCLQPFDVDGDGRVDFALGAAWRPTDTKTGGTLQILTRTGAKEGTWRVVPIGSEPTLHRVRWGDVLGTGKPQLVVAPLQGRGTSGPNWANGAGSRILIRSIPARPFIDEWPVEVADESLHTVHNIQVVDLDGDGKPEILAAAHEGVWELRRGKDGTWSKEWATPGGQAPSGTTRAASEIKVGRLRNGDRYFATIEPWHGSQVVVYSEARIRSQELWKRLVIDEPVAWGHAVWTVDLDGDGDDEIVVGQRDPSKGGRTPKGPGVLVYDPTPGGAGFDRHVIDDGGVAVEDLVAADLDGDGRPEIVAGGRATHNVKIYWNLGPR